MVTKWSLVRVRSHIRVKNVQEILFGADKVRSHKTSWSHIRGSFVAGTTVPTYFGSAKCKAYVLKSVNR